jgi:prolyl-tRNA synthetase
MKYNQWCSVLRWEKTTRPFLRGREFLWQEGHTLHETEAEAREETLHQLEVYADMCENYLAMPVIRGNKTEKEKFAGAVNTYTIECMMHDHKALQSGTSHYFGTGFAEQFNITFTDRENKQRYPHQTSWGMSTRIIGGIIMTHGDNNGLVLPPRIAPVQVIVVPVAQHKEGVTEKATELYDALKAAGIRAKIDLSDNSLGWKCAQYEMKGVPLRIEIGPRDIENGVCMAVRRDNGEKTSVALSELTSKVPELLDAVQQGLFDKAKKNLDEHIFEAHSLEEAKQLQEEKGGFIKTMWCGELDCELKMKEQAGMSSRCIPFKQEDLGDTCPICGKKAKHMIYWGVAY